NTVPRLNLRFHPDRDQFLTAALHNDARQRTRRRSLQHRSVSYRKVTLVTGALQPIMSAGIEDRARQVRTFLAICDIGIFRSPDKDALLAWLRILEQFHAPDGNLSGSRDHT